MKASRRKRALAVAVLLLALCAAAALLFVNLGKWLMLEDPLQPARAIAVLGGQVPFRAMEAAAIYKQGWAPEVWLTRMVAHPEDVAIARMGIDRPLEDVYSRRVLERLGVPPASIHLLPEACRDTYEELGALARALQSAGGTRLIVVTSKYHTRRVKIIWRAVAGKPLTAIVRYTREDPFQAAGWWRDSSDAQAVAHECIGILNAWAGFPIKSRR